MNRETRNKLIGDNLKLVPKLVNKKFGTFSNAEIKEDLIAQGYLILAETMHKYDATKGFALSTYICNVIYWRLLRYIKETFYKHKDVLSLDCEYKTDITLLDMVEGESIDLEKMDLNLAIEKLKGLEKIAVKMYYLQGMTIPEIVKKTGIPRSTMMFKLYEGRQKLIDFFNDGKEIVYEKKPTAKQISEATGMSIRTIFRKKALGKDIYALYYDAIKNRTMYKKEEVK